MRARALLTARVWVLGISSIGAGVLLAALFARTHASTAVIALLLAAAVATELIQVAKDESSPDPGDAHSFSFSTGVHIAAILIIGPWTGALVAAFGVLVADRLRGERWLVLAYNASAFAISALAGGYAFIAAGGNPGSLDLPHDLVPLLALSLVLFAVNTGLMSAVVSLHTGTDFWPLARDAGRDGRWAAVEESAFGLALAFFALVEPWAIVALVPLVLAVFRSYERLAALRRETAHALETFANVVDERDAYTFQHSARVAEYVRSLAEGLGLPPAQIARLRWAGRLHDLGKVTVDAAILRKPGALDDDEWAVMRMHPRLSARLLRRFRFAAHEARAVEYHHERADGRGYYGLDSGEIPLASHFLVVADSFDAMTSDRPYRAGLSTETALAEIEKNAGTQFHPLIAKAFVALQRGHDPADALTREERAEIARLLSVKPRTARWGRVAVPDPRMFSAVGIVGALVAVGIGVPALAPVGAVIALGGIVLVRRRRRRAGRLAGSLREACRTSLRQEAFANVAASVGASFELRWAGLLSWDERQCAGALELDWDDGSQGPSQTALTSWLLREAEATGQPVVSAKGELGKEGHVALPLRSGGVLAGFVVFAVRGAVPPALVEALASCDEELASALLAPHVRGAPVLAAIAS